MNDETMAESTESSGERRSLQLRRLIRKAREAGTPVGVDVKRNLPRFRYGSSLEITTNPGVPGQTTTAKFHNVSSGGAAFWSRKPMTPMKQLFIRCFDEDGPSEWFPVVVRHCTRGIMGFLVGVEFQSD